MATLPSNVEPLHRDTAADAEIRGVTIQVEGARLLLPNAIISEVLTYATPEPVESAPDWLLGRIRWRGWRLPLMSFSRLAGIADEGGTLSSKVIVLKALGGNSDASFFALLTQGFPRLVTISRATVTADADDAQPLPPAVLARVLLNEDAAWVPDLERIEQLIAETLRKAA